MYFILIYETVDNYVEKRKPYRSEHLAMLTTHLDSNHIVLGGAVNDPPDKAYIIWNVDSKEIVEDFVKNDPYVKNGLVSKYEIRSWNVVIDKTGLS